MARIEADNGDTGQLHRRLELRTDPLPIPAEQWPLRAEPNGLPPPGDIVIARDDHYRGMCTELIEPPSRRTELALEVPLREIPADDHHLIAPRRDATRDRIDLRGDRMPAEVDVGKLEEAQNSRGQVTGVR